MEIGGELFQMDFIDEKDTRAKRKKEEAEAAQRAAKQDEKREAQALLKAADVLDQIELAREELREGINTFDSIMSRSTADFYRLLNESKDGLRLASVQAASAAFNDLDAALVNQKQRIAAFDGELSRVQDRIEALREGISAKIVFAAGFGACLGACLGVFLYVWLR